MENQSTILFPPQHLNYIMAMLDKQPHGEVAQIMGNIYQQLQQQQQRQQEQYKQQLLSQEAEAKKGETGDCNVAEIKKK